MVWGTLNAIFHKLFGGDFERVPAVFDPARVFAVFHVGKFHPAVSDGTAAVFVEGKPCCGYPDFTVMLSP